MLRSLRLRLTLMSALLAGLALGGFAALAWWSVRAALLRQLDADMRTFLLENGSVARQDSTLAELESRLAQRFAGGDRHKVLVLALDEAGNRLYASPMALTLHEASIAWPRVPDRLPAAPLDDPLSGHLPPGPPPPPAVTLAEIRLQGNRWFLAMAAFRHARLAIGVDPVVVAAGMQPLNRACMVFIPLSLAFIAGGAWLLAGAALRRVSHLSRLISQVTARGLDQRLAPDEVDREFARLVAVFNAMLERLERSFLQASRFSAEAAHELKTPLAILQGQLERAIGEAEDGSTLQGLLTHTLDEVRRLSSITNKLLLLSQADAGRLRVQPAALDLSAVLEELVDDARMLAPSLAISGDIAAGLCVEVDRDLLIQVLHNLLSNAIKYNRHDPDVRGTQQGWLRITATSRPPWVEVVFANAAAGIPPADHERIFERFYRVDVAHNRAVDGVGLGLSVAREIARAHDGDLLLLPTDASGEVRFLLRLPRQASREK